MRSTHLLPLKSQVDEPPGALGFGTTDPVPSRRTQGVPPVPRLHFGAAPGIAARDEPSLALSPPGGRADPRNAELASPSTARQRRAAACGVAAGSARRSLC